MATRFIDKETGATTSTAIANDATGRIKVPNLPDAVGIVYDKVDDKIKFNAEGTIRAIADSAGSTITPTAAVTLTPLQSGSTVFLNAAAGFAITLPLPAAGLKYRFQTAAAFATTDFTIVSNGNATIIQGGAWVNAAFVAAANEDTISFVATAETVGDYVDVVSDGTNWYASGHAVTAGAVTFTDAA